MDIHGHVGGAEGFESELHECVCTYALTLVTS